MNGAHADRRIVLKATGTTLLTLGLAGCSSMNLLDTGPKYEPENIDSLRMGIEAFPDGWERLPDDFNDFFAVFANQDRSIFVMYEISIYEKVSTSEDEFSRVRQTYAETNDYDIGDAGFWAESTDGTTDTHFRESNALAQVTGAKRSGIDWAPAVRRSTQYAKDLYDHW